MTIRRSSFVSARTLAASKTGNKSVSSKPASASRQRTNSSAVSSTALKSLKSPTARISSAERSTVAFPTTPGGYTAGVSVQNGTLRIEGTDSADKIKVFYNQRTNQYEVTVKGAPKQYVPGDQVQRIEVAGGAGEDRIELHKSVMVASQIDGGDGRDIISGGSGADVIIGGQGRDVIHGGAGNDRLVGETAWGRTDNENDVLYGDAGNDTLEGGGGDDKLLGGNDNDLLIGGAGSDLLKGMAGADRYVLVDGSVDTVIDKSGRNRVLNKDRFDKVTVS